MDDSSNGNGTPNGRNYVKFGPGDTQQLPVEWAEKMLTKLYAEHAPVFGRLLQDAAGVPARRR